MRYVLDFNISLNKAAKVMCNTSNYNQESCE